MRKNLILMLALAGASITGCSGSKGLQGDPGPAGAAGPTGAAGASGANGTPGVTGPSGAAGAAGATGASGADGASGATGTQGAMGATGTPGPIDPTIPPTPDTVYLTAKSGPNSQFDLHWNMPASGATIEYFVLYQSSAPIAANFSFADQQLIPATSRKTTVQIQANSGMRYFAVSAVSYTGVEGLISEEFAIDTTSRIAVRSDSVTAGVQQLQVVHSGGDLALSSLPTLNGSYTTGQAVNNFAWSPTATELAFSANLAIGGGTTVELWVAPASGPSPSPAFNVSGTTSDGTIVALGNVSNANTPPTWSPDGKTIAFLGDLITHTVNELFLAGSTAPTCTPGMAGSCVKRLNPAIADTVHQVRDFAWSPDGTMIAYRSQQLTGVASRLELFVVPAAGGASTKLSGTLQAPAGNSVGNFAWSPDSSRVAFVAPLDTSLLPELYVAPTDGSSITKLSGTMQGAGVRSATAFAAFQWSPAGDRIAFIATKDQATTRELYVVGSSGGAITKVSGTIPTGNSVNNFAWSPNGHELVMIANQSDHNDVYIVQATGGTPVAAGKGMTTNAVVTPKWSNNGTNLAFMFDRDGSQHFDLIGATDTTLASSIDLVNPPFSSDPNTLASVGADFAWSPDGNSVAFRADSITSGAQNLFVQAGSGAGSNLLLINYSGGGSGIQTGFAWSPLGALR
jgi:Tol biopolymer transport system component